MYMPLFAKNLYFVVIMHAFLSFSHIYAVLFNPLREATGLALSQKAADDLKGCFCIY